MRKSLEYYASCKFLWTASFILPLDKGEVIQEYSQQNERSDQCQMYLFTLHSRDPEVNPQNGTWTGQFMSHSLLTVK